MTFLGLCIYVSIGNALVVLRYLGDVIDGYVRLYIPRFEYRLRCAIKKLIRSRSQLMN